MRLYWKEVRKGMDLMVLTEDGQEFSVGGVRVTKRGVEAIAKTQGYDPGRATRGLAAVDDGRMFVEQFEPWRDFFPGEPMSVEADVVKMEAGA
ncbi:MAG: hypothetical protein EXR57_04730 [Dehalococcoidia bacterium]|nr:hypothetical protein [Dehalococcoidia bacterium]MSQ35105.1 hypothetical protein [Dehalococcoidia bacterium]